MAFLDEMESRADGTQFTALGAYVFAGAFSLGAEAAGFKVVGHLEDSAVELGFEASRRRGWPVFAGSASEWTSVVGDIVEAGLQPDFVYANPPCSAYSKQGDRGGMDNPVMDCTKRAVDAGLELQPHVFTWECVVDLFDDAEGGGRQFLDDTAERFNEAGYVCYAFITTSAIHGGYQNRKRFHFVASKSLIDWEQLLAAEPADRRGHRTLGQALELVEAAVAINPMIPNHELEKLSGGQLLSILPFCPPGSYLREVNDELMKRHYRPRGQDWDGKSRAGVAQCRGRRDRVCPVITGGHSVVHPDRDRFLTVRESATVMGFPMDFEFSTGTSGYAEVGKGLCVQTASFVCRAAMAARRSAVCEDPPLGLQVVDWRARGEVLSLPSTPEERQAWFAAKHPNLPLAWAEPWKQKQGGRPKGSVNGSGKGKRAPKVPAVRDPAIVVIGDPTQARLDAIKGMGIQIIDLNEALDRSIVDAIVLFSPMTAMMSYGYGVAWALDVPLVHVGSKAEPSAIEKFAHPKQVVAVQESASAQATAMAVAEVVGVDLTAVAAKLVASMSPKDLIAMLRGAA